MIHKFLFFISEAFIGMRRSSAMIFVAHVTIFISLLVFGLFLIVHINLSDLSHHISSKLEIRTFLSDSLTKREINAFRETLLDINGVDDVIYIDKKVAWNEFLKTYDNLQFKEFLDDNPLPHSFNIKLSESNKLKEISMTIRGFDQYVTDVVYGGVLAEKLQKSASFVSFMGWILVAVFSLATFLIMVNTIRLTILNRQEEITVMKLVGATDAFVMGPFLIEGLLIGLVASFMAVFVLATFAHFISVKLQLYVPFLPVNLSSDTLLLVYALVMVWGVFLGGAGAMISMRRTLKNVY